VLADEGGATTHCKHCNTLQHTVKPIGALANEEGLVAWAAAAVLKSLAFSHVLHAPLV